VSIHVARHLVAATRHVPSDNHSQVRETMKLVEGTLREPETVGLATFKEVWLANGLVASPEVSVLYGGSSVTRQVLIAVRSHFFSLFHGEFWFAENSMGNIDPLNGS
jgi:hypothetical protein